MLIKSTISGQLNSDVSIPETNRKIFSDLLTDLKKSLKKSSERRDIVLPLECHYLNKNAFLSVVGHQPQTTKHFSLRRKPKAAALRAELLNKSQVRMISVLIGNCVSIRFGPLLTTFYSIVTFCAIIMSVPNLYKPT